MGISLDEILLDASTSSIAISDGTDTLAVNADGSLNAVVSATDLDIRDLAFATDSVDVSGSEVSLSAGTLAALENITVSATDLDIRDLAFATDKVDVTGSEVSLSSGTLAALENITVSATDLDIRDLAFATDSVDVSGSTLGANSGVDIGDVTINNAAGAAAVNIQDGGNSITVDGEVELGATSLAALESISVTFAEYAAMQHSAATVTTTAAQVLAAPLSGRKEVTIQNEGSQPVYIGSTSGVTSATGIKISKNSSATYMIPAGVDIFMVAASGSQSVRFLELG